MPPSHPQHPGIVAPCSSSADHRPLAAPSGLILAPTTGHGAHSGISEVLVMVGRGRLGWVRGGPVAAPLA
jgi:hypothetical protein